MNYWSVTNTELIRETEVRKFVSSLKRKIDVKSLTIHINLYSDKLIEISFPSQGQFGLFTFYFLLPDETSQTILVIKRSSFINL